MGSLFISHSSDDSAVAAELMARIVGAGYVATFLDQDPVGGLVGGERWEEQLYGRLRASDVVLFLGTAAAARSPWCFAEIALARSIGKPIIPLRVEAGAELSLIADIQWIRAEDGAQWWDPLLRALHRLGVSPEMSFAWDRDRCPYPGMNPFQPEDAGVFFGRDDEIRLLLSRMRPSLERGASQAVTVVGPSGSGKSSLVRAGLVPRLLRRAGEFHVMPVLTPGTAPITGLALALASGRPDGVSWRTIAGWVAGGSVSALQDHLVDRLDTGNGGAHLVVIVDQAEELLRADEETQRRFLAALAGMQAGTAPVTTVLTLRSHFLEACQLVAPGDYLTHLVSVRPLDRPRLAAAVRRPAEMSHVRIADDVVEAIVAEAGGGDLMPLMAYTMRKLYEDTDADERRYISAAAYERLGGVIGTMARQADLAVELVCRRHEPAALWRTLLKLVSVGHEREPVRRQVGLAHLDRDERDIIDAFVNSRLLTSGEDGHVEVAHEALFRRWPPFVSQIDAAIPHLQSRSELEIATARWLASSRAPARLLPSDRLEEALRWAREHPFDLDDMPEMEEYLHESQLAQLSLLARRAAATAEHVVNGYPPDLGRRQAIMLELGEAFPDLPVVQLAAGIVRGRDTLRTTIELPSPTVGRLAASPGGTSMATMTEGGDAVVLDLLAGRIAAVVPLGRDPAVDPCLLDAAGLLAVTRGDDVEIWDWAAGTLVDRLRHPCPVVATAGDGEHTLVSVDQAHVLRWWSTSGEVERTWDLGEVAATEIAISDGVVAVLDGSGVVTMLPPVGEPVTKPAVGTPAKGLTGIGGGAFVVVDRASAPSTADELSVLRPDAPARSWVWEPQRIRSASVSDGCTAMLVSLETGGTFVEELDSDLEWDLGHHEAGAGSTHWADDLHSFVTTNGAAVHVWQLYTTDLLAATSSRGTTELAWSHGGGMLASVGHDGRVAVWDVVDRSLSLAATLVHDETPTRPTWSFDDSVLATLCRDGVRMWPGDGTAPYVVPTGTPPTDVAFGGDDGRLLVVGFADGPARVWDWRDAVEVDPLPASEGVTSLGGEGGRVFAIRPDGRGILCWDRLDRPPETYCPERPVTVLVPGADGRVLAGTDAGELAIVSGRGEVETTLRGDELTYVDWSPSRGRAVTATDRGSIQVLSPDGTRSSWASTGVRICVVEVRDSDGLLAIGDDQGALGLMSTSDAGTDLTVVAEHGAHTGGLVAVEWSPGDGHLLAVTEAGRLLLRRPRHRFAEADIAGVGTPVVGAGFQPGGSMIVQFADESMSGVGLDGQETFHVPSDLGPAQAFAVDPNGGFLVAGRDGRLRRWSSDGCELAGCDIVPPVVSLSVASARAGRWAALVEGGEVVLGEGPAELGRWRLETDEAGSGVDLAPDGLSVALTGPAGLEIWLLEQTGARRLTAIQDGTCCAWSADGTHLGVGMSHGGVDVRHTTSWQVVGRASGHPGVPRCVAWSRDGRFVAGGCDRGFLTVDEHLAMDELLTWLRGRDPEPLTSDERDRFGIPPTLRPARR